MNSDMNKEQAEKLACLVNDNKQPDVRQEGLVALETLREVRAMLHQVSGSAFVAGERHAENDAGIIYNLVCKANNCLLYAYDIFEAALQSPSVANTPQDVKPVAWVRFCSDGCYEGPIMDCDKRMDGRRESGAWTPLYSTPPTVDAAVEAFRQTAVDIVKGWEETALHYGFEGDASQFESVANEIRALPGSKSALDEYVEAKCMEVAKEVGMALIGLAASYRQEALRAIVRRVLDEKGE